MEKQTGPVIDMTKEGGFVERPAPSLGTILARVATFAVALGVVAVAFWVALFMIPVLLILGIAGFFVLRSQLRRNGTAIFRRRF